MKLFRDRWGHVLPDDDAGRGDLFELIMNISLSPVAVVEKKMACAIEIWAPWMQPDEAKELVHELADMTMSGATPASAE
jgi:hypothetical protein